MYAFISVAGWCVCCQCLPHARRLFFLSFPSLSLSAPPLPPPPSICAYPCYAHTHVHVHSGLLPPRTVLCMLRFAQRAVSASQAQWCALTVWGFPDSPVSWERGGTSSSARRSRDAKTKEKKRQQQKKPGSGGRGGKGNAEDGHADVHGAVEFHEHGYLAGGENDYTIIVVRGRSWVLSATGAYDELSY